MVSTAGTVTNRMYMHILKVVSPNFVLCKDGESEILEVAILLPVYTRAFHFEMRNYRLFKEKGKKYTLHHIF